MNQHRAEQELLRKLLRSLPDAEKIVAECLPPRRPRGRPATPKSNYRTLWLRWLAFRRLHRDLAEPDALKKYWRANSREIEGVLKIIRTGHSRRNAITRGKKEHKRVKADRARDWRIVRLGLFGRATLVTDPAEAAYLEHMQRLALLGE